MTKISNLLIIFILLVPPLVFFTDLTRNPYYFQIFLLNVSVLFFWILFLLKSIKTSQIRWVISPIDIPLGFFIFFSFLSWIYTYLFPPSYLQPEIIDYGKKFIGIDFYHSAIFSEGSKKLIFTLVNILMVYWISANFLEPNTKFFKVCLYTLFFTGFIAAFYAILQYSGIEIIWPQALNPFCGRPVSTFGNPNFLSSYLVMILPVLIFHYLIKINSKYNSTFKIIFLIIILVYCGALISTLTRSSWSGFIFSMFFLFFYIYKTDKNFLFENKNYLIILFLCVFGLFYFWPKSQGGYTTINRISEIGQTPSKPYGPVHQRLMIWSCAWDMIKENPVLGKGWGLFELFFPFYQGKYMFDKIYRNFRTHANNAHNEILEIWSQTGTIGFGMYIWFLVCVFIYGIKISNSLDKKNRLLVISLLASIAGMLVDNLLNVSTQFCIPAFLYWWIFGLIVSMDPNKKIYEIKVKPAIKYVFVILILFFGFLIYRVYMQFIGEINYFSGFKLSKRNEISKAIHFLEKSDKCYREVNSEYELANCYARIGQIEKAIKAYYNALSANFGYDEIHFNLATVFAQKGDKTNAILNYNQTLFINPISRECYFALGNFFLNNIKEYLDNGLKLFNQAVVFFPENPDLYNNLGYLYTQKNDYENAVKCYKQSIKLNPQFELAKHNLVVALKKTGISDDPILKYDYYIKELETGIQKNKWEDNVKLCEKLIELFPNDFKVRFYYANVLFTIGKIDDAIIQYKKAIEINSRNIYSHINLGIAYMKKGLNNLAKEEFNEALNIDPNNEIAKMQLMQLSR